MLRPLVSLSPSHSPQPLRLLSTSQDISNNYLPYSSLHALAALDARCYPHFLDLIVNSAPYASLVRFRGVSRHLRERADALLTADRLILTSPPTSNNKIRRGKVKMIVSSPQGRVPAFASWALNEHTGLELLDAARNATGGANLHSTGGPAAAVRIAIRPNLKHTQAIDLVGDVGSAYMFTLLKSTKLNPRLTLRLRSQPNHHVPRVDTFTNDPWYTLSVTTTVKALALLELFVSSDEMLAGPGLELLPPSRIIQRMVPSRGQIQVQTLQVSGAEQHSNGGGRSLVVPSSPSANTPPAEKKQAPERNPQQRRSA